MTINPMEVINFIKGQKETFEQLILERDRDDFYRGTMEGMKLVENYINTLMDAQDKGMGKTWGEKLKEEAKEFNDD